MKREFDRTEKRAAQGHEIKVPAGKRETAGQKNDLSASRKIGAQLKIATFKEKR